MSDIKGWSTWVLGVQTFNDAWFLRRDAHCMWHWTRDVFKATTFDNRERAEVSRLRHCTMLAPNGRRAVPLKVALKVGV